MRCLIVDDEQRVAQALQRLLEMWGHEAHTVGNGEQALALLERESFDLLMLDYRMPGLNGIETWERIRAREGAVRHVVLITAALEGEILAKRHAIEFLAKPFDIDSLEALLERALRSHEGG
jgi:DNA-binding response OmpR family regulator